MLLLAAVLAPAACAHARDPLVAAYPAAQCSRCAEWIAPQEPFRLFGNTWFVGTHGLSAILVTSPRGHVLIDAGLPNSAPLILHNIRSLGFKVSDVVLVLNSHVHFDHAGGIAAVVRASGAQVMASRPSAGVLEAGRSDPDDPQYGILLPFPAVPSVTRFNDGDTVRAGALALTGYLTPGHTAGGTTWTWVSCEGSRCLHFVYADSQSPVSADGFRFSRNDTYPTAVADFEHGFAVLERLPCDILITPHPDASRLWERLARGPEDLVDSGACRSFAAAARQQLQRRLAAEAAQP